MVLVTEWMSDCARHIAPAASSLVGVLQELPNPLLVNPGFDVLCITPSVLYWDLDVLDQDLPDLTWRSGCS